MDTSRFWAVLMGLCFVALGAYGKAPVVYSKPMEIVTIPRSSTVPCPALTRDEVDWVGNMNYTISLATATRLEPLDQLVEKYHLQDTARCYVRFINGVLHYQMIYGDFQTREHAQEAADYLQQVMNLQKTKIVRYSMVAHEMNFHYIREHHDV